MKKYRYILLDWDGSVVQTLDIWLECLKTSLQQRGYLFKDKEIGADFAAFKARQQSSGIKDFEGILDAAIKQAALRTPKVGLYPDVRETLRALRRADKRLALVTTSLHQDVDPLLQKHELGQLFNAVVCGDDVTYLKPHAEPLRKALEMLEADKGSAVMIGDSEKDIEAAKNAGIDSILFYPPHHSVFYELEELQRHHPTYIMQHFSELLTLISA